MSSFFQKKKVVLIVKVIEYKHNELLVLKKKVIT